MCGIIGRIGIEKNCKKTLEGLQELEYRGYDSHGVYFWNQESYVIHKETKSITQKQIKKLSDIQSSIEIGHTRWATHGRVTKENAHPHFDSEKTCFVVMNGIIENHSDIKKELENKGNIFSSETDTEVIPQLFSFLLQQNKEIISENKIRKTIQRMLRKLKGEFSFLLTHKEYLIGYKNVNPLIVGVLKKENITQKNSEVLFSSDLGIVQNQTKEYCILEDGEIVISRKDELKKCILIHTYDELGNRIKKKFSESKKQKKSLEKNTTFFMEKEIKEQKDINKFFTAENLTAIAQVVGAIRENKHKQIYITGAGTSFNAGNYLHYTLLEYGINSQCILASELKNYTHLIKNALIFCLSQSGETADLIQPLKELQESKKRNTLISIINTEHSTLDRASNISIHLHCGKEIAVASTKAFGFQMMVAEVIRACLSEYDLKSEKQKFETIFDETISQIDREMKQIAKQFFKQNTKHCFFIGRNKRFSLAIEGALKLKEISYIHAEGFAGGELKHGSLALIEKGTPAIVIGNDSEVISNAIEIKTRGGFIIGIATENNNAFESFIEVPKTFKHLFSVIAMQLLAFHVTVLKGFSPDKPRNLAKSVTVK